jgi:hypothetical protein
LQALILKYDLRMAYKIYPQFEDNGSAMYESTLVLVKSTT